MPDTTEWRVISQGILQQPCKSLELCPSGDLFAVIDSQGSQVQLVRLKGQRVWTVTSATFREYGSELEFVSLGWRPDGKILVIGTNRGMAFLCDITDGKLVFTIISNLEIPFCCVSYIKWVEEVSSVLQNMQSSQRAFPRSSDFLPKLKALKRTETNTASLYALGHDLGENRNQSLDIVVMGTGMREVTLRVFGTFEIGTLDLGHHTKFLQHCSTKDFRRQALLLRNGIVISLATLRTADLQSDELALRDITAISYTTEMLLAYVDSCLTAMKSEWDLVDNMRMGHIASLKSLMDNYESEEPLQSIELELLDVLMSGYAVEPVHEWILTKLTRRVSSQMSRIITDQMIRVLNDGKNHPSIYMNFFEE